MFADFASISLASAAGLTACVVNVHVQRLRLKPPCWFAVNLAALTPHREWVHSAAMLPTVLQDSFAENANFLC